MSTDNTASETSAVDPPDFEMPDAGEVVAPDAPQVSNAGDLEGSILAKAYDGMIDELTAVVEDGGVLGMLAASSLRNIAAIGRQGAISSIQNTPEWSTAHAAFVDGVVTDTMAIKLIELAQKLIVAYLLPGAAGI